MGSYDVSCAVSGLPLSGKTVLLLTKSDIPVTVPFYGEYDTYGGIEIEKASPTAEAVWPLEKTSGHPAELDLEALSQMLRGDFVGENWVDGCLDAYLINGKLYDAIVQTVLTGGHGRWGDFKQEALEATPASELLTKAFPRPESEKVYGSFTDAQREELKPELIRLIAFRQWPAELEERECDDQYYSNDDLDASSNIVSSWREYPDVAKVIDEVVASWKEEYGEDD